MAHLIAGQHVDKDLRERTRELRRQMTEAERVLWFHLRAHRLKGSHFRRQQPVAGYIVDFYCDAAHLVVEVDGPVHGNQVDYDADRDQVLGAHGLHVVRVSNEQVITDLAAVLTRIAEWLPPEPSFSAHAL